jgi:hypothetical protein
MRGRKGTSIRTREWVEERIEARVLTMILDSYPAARTLPELSRELGDRGAVNKALCSLAEYGLLQFEGPSRETLRPTLAARRCGRLLRGVPRPVRPWRMKGDGRRA